MTLPMVGETVRWRDLVGVVEELLNETSDSESGVSRLEWTVVVRDADGVLHWAPLRELDGYKA